MALKAKKTEMKGATSRWMTREEAKKGSKKVRRRVGKDEVRAQLKETPKVG
jgi:hypothetical protein